jgi:predicted amidohydrolase YtcJ
VTHATGDRGVHEALNAYRVAGAAPGVRHRIEHIETIQPRDLGRFAAERVVASMQPQHMIDLAPDRGDNWSRRMGHARSHRAFPIRALAESGARVAFGSDWPVAPCDWREGMAAAQLRRPPRQRDRGVYDAQGVDALTALHGYTRHAAMAVGEQDNLGMIRVGRLADLTILSEDPVMVAADDLIDVPVVATVVGGEPVYTAPSLAAI